MLEADQLKLQRMEELIIHVISSSQSGLGGMSFEAGHTITELERVVKTPDSEWQTRAKKVDQILGILCQYLSDKNPAVKEHCLEQLNGYLDFLGTYWRNPTS